MAAASQQNRELSGDLHCGERDAMRVGVRGRCVMGGIGSDA